jgi:glycosyltransferase involved in cell wall biosynthesis
MAHLQLRPVATFEAHAVASVAGVLAVSRDEQAAFERIAPGRVHLVPNGVDTGAVIAFDAAPASRSLLYVGSMAYAPNAEAATHFLDDVAPLISADGVSLEIVGANPPPAVGRAAERSVVPTTVSGFVPDLSPHYSGKRAMIVPLRHGGGTRLKILEALARGLPVVSTPVGCAGLGATDGREILIADSPHAFAAAIDRLVADDELWSRLSRAGRAFVERHFDWRQIGATLDGVMRELATRP